MHPAPTAHNTQQYHCASYSLCTPCSTCSHDHKQAKAATQEQHKLLAEKAALIETVKRLNREVAKLEQFKRSLLQQLQDDEDDSSSGHVGTTGEARWWAEEGQQQTGRQACQP